MPSSRFQALNVSSKQESSANKDQHPSFKLAWLSLVRTHTTALHVREQLAKSTPDAYLTRKFNVMAPVRQTKPKGLVSRKLPENFKNSSPHSPLQKDCP